MTGALDWCSLLDDVCSHIVQTTIKILSIYYTHCIWESVTSNVIVIIDFYLHKTSDILGNPLFVSNVWATNIINVTTESSFCYVAGVLSARNTVWPASAWSGIMEQVSEKMWAQHSLISHCLTCLRPNTCIIILQPTDALCSFTRFSGFRDTGSIISFPLVCYFSL